MSFIEIILPPKEIAEYVHILRLGSSPSLSQESRYKIIQRRNAFTISEEYVNLRIYYKRVDGENVMFIEYDQNTKDSTFGKEVAYCIRNHLTATQNLRNYCPDIAILSCANYKDNSANIKATLEYLELKLDKYNIHKEPVLYNECYWVGFSYKYKHDGLGKNSVE